MPTDTPSPTDEPTRGPSDGRSRGPVHAIGAGLRDAGGLLRRRGVLLAGGLVLCMCWDRAAYLGLSVGASLGDPAAQQARKSALEHLPLFAGVKFLGEVYLPLALAGVLLVVDMIRARRAGARRFWDFALRRATLLALTPLLAGGLAELCKGVLRRERPLIALDESKLGGWYHFRWWWDGPLDWSGLGMGSSHAAVALAWALVLGGFFPAARWVFVGLALCVGASRVLAGAHFVSDVYIGYVCAWLAFVTLRGADRFNHGGPEREEREGAAGA